jgi:hypothetical protein
VTVAYLQSLSLVTGTASDPNLLAGATVQVIVPTGADTPYAADCWNGTGWQACPYRLGARKTGGVGGDWTWEFDSLPTTWRDGAIYKIKVIATDSDGREQSALAVTETTFTIDTSNSVSSTTFPRSGASFSSLTFSSGTASDAGSGVDPAKVEFALEREDDQKYWNPPTQSFISPGVPIWSTAAYSVAAGSWTFSQIDTSDPDFVSDTWYRVKEKVTDKLGNVPNITHADIHSNGVRIKIDKNLPVSVTTAPVLSSGATAYLNTMFTVFAGTASDFNGAGLKEIKLRVSSLDSSWTRRWYNWFTGFDVGYSDNFETGPDFAATPAQWFKTLSESQKSHFTEGYRYEIQSQALDLAVNTAGTPTNYELSYTTAVFVLDYTTPTVQSLTFSTSSANYIYNTQLASGTFNEPDTAGGHVDAGVDKVYYRIQDITDGAHTPSDNYYWNGSTWAVSVSTLEAVVHTSSWSIASAALPSPVYWSRWDTSPVGRKYRMNLWVRDRALNMTDPEASYADLIFDSSAPVSSVVNPAAPDGRSLDIVGIIAGTAMDPSTSTVRAVYISVQNRDDNSCGHPEENGKYWNGSAWASSADRWFPSTSYDGDTKIWQYAPAPSLFWRAD